MLNKAQIIGHLGRDPETRVGQSGSGVCSFSVATTEKWNSNGETRERTEWHYVTAFGKLAEVCQKYLVKGKQVYVEGRIQTDEYQDKDGVKKRSTKIIANEVKFLGGGNKGNGDEKQGNEQQSLPHERPAPESKFDDDDIPF